MAVSRRQYEQLQARLGGKRAPEPVFAATPAAASRNQIIIGVDPSLRGTGYGVVHSTGSVPRALAYGTISCPAAWDRSRCLVKIGHVLREVIQGHRPTVCAIEALFYAQNLQTALIMGEARGAALAVLAEAGLDIYEIAPRKVKQALVGYGAAQKVAVGKMVQRLLQLTELPAPDAADALALALAYAHDSRCPFGTGLKKI
jgi:crossover junction endodeoxyribonuclease RuvC